MSGEIATPEAARQAFFNLYEQGLHDLGYRTVLQRPIRREGRIGGLKYVLVFATDNDTGRKIMDYCFKKVFPRVAQMYLPGLEPQLDLS